MLSLLLLLLSVILAEYCIQGARLTKQEGEEENARGYGRLQDRELEK